MDTTEKQESQKTVVAFIAGLLIGGLLVWVFSSSPKNDPVTKVTDTDKTEQSTDTNSELTASDDASGDAMTADTKAKPTTSGEVKVNDQAAGSIVKIGKVTFPTTDGWVIVRDYNDGVIGNILGASRYSTGVGLLPETIELLRPTIAGKTYRVTFLKEDGDKKLSSTKDVEIAGTEVFFKAQ